MKIFRGPSSKPFLDDSHELVSRVKPHDLEKGVRDKALIKFNITKDGLERQAICTAQFEDDDLIPMINGLVARLSGQQDALKEIKKTILDKGASNDQKMLKIGEIMERVK
ncbi:hypothetical protein [Massilia sp. ZL223]|uniref:hypothetical protein n=1 Tax=Massilia sp. ZL223 TaxID=2824904 RepID=UPI001B845324|nr:hypothetical protein [Massilia sp. ZL223]MBQ5964297.1 hypothetical protein [Massilia sp. ZL223]